MSRRWPMFHYYSLLLIGEWLAIEASNFYWCMRNKDIYSKLKYIWLFVDFFINKSMGHYVMIVATWHCLISCILFWEFSGLIWNWTWWKYVVYIKISNSNNVMLILVFLFNEKRMNDCFTWLLISEPILCLKY